MPAKSPSIPYSEIRGVDSEEETGVLVSQYPPAGTRVLHGTSVSFEVRW